MRTAYSRRCGRSCLSAGATAREGDSMIAKSLRQLAPQILRDHETGARSRLVLVHRDADAALRGDLAGAVVASVDVPDHARARVVGQHALEFARCQRRAVGHADLARVDRAADADSAAVVY